MFASSRFVLPTFARLAVLAAALGPALLSGAPAMARERPVVVELFTSQGCSSCPPAEAVLAELARRPDVLALGFHVTYWDDLGWKDPFSFEGATQRQAAYSGQLGSGTSFTPQMVVDGRYSLVGSRRAEAASTLAKAAGQASTAADVAVTRKGGRVSVTIGAGSGSARVLLVGYDPAHSTAIARGENGGRTIAQANVVRSLRAIAAWNGAALTLNEAAPVGQDIAVLLQESSGRIVGAARSAS